MPLTPDQQAAVEAFKDFLLDPTKKEMLLNGYSGTGKTTTTKVLIEEAHKISALLAHLTGSNQKLNIIPTATTNKAAKVLSEKLGMPAQTIHSLLNVKPKTNYQTGKQYLVKTGKTEIVQNALLILDESSMVGDVLFTFVRESTLNCKVLWIGDGYQINSVNEPQCVVFNCPYIDVEAKLTTIVRQSNAPTNQIPLVGEMYRNAIDTGKFPTFVPNGVDIIHCDGPEFQRRIEQEFSNIQSLDQARILAWSNDVVKGYNKHVREFNGLTGDYTVGETLAVNKTIQCTQFAMSSAYTDQIVKVVTEPQGTGLTYETVPIKIIRVADIHNPRHVITLRVPVDQDAYRAYMKDLAKEGNRLTRQKSPEASGVWRRFYSCEEGIADLRPTHASTVHKSQGSTYERVYINLNDIARNNKWYEVARLLYVAITRASKQVILYGKLPTKYWGNQ